MKSVWEIEGSFNQQKIRLEMSLLPTSDTFVILMHGAYGYPYHSVPTKYQFLMEKLSTVCNVGLYQTSRNFEWQEKPDLSFEEYRDLSFKGKNFLQEKEDVERACTALIEAMKKKKKNIPRVILVGFSLGGLMAFLAKQKDVWIDAVVTFGTALNFSLDKNFPIINTLPDDEEILQSIHEYLGKVKFILGTDDDLSSFDKTLALFSAAVQAEKRGIELWKGIDHRFKNYTGKEDEVRINKMILKEIVNII